MVNERIYWEKVSTRVVESWAVESGAGYECDKPDSRQNGQTTLQLGYHIRHPLSIEALEPSKKIS